MAKENRKEPPLYIPESMNDIIECGILPSSGSIVRVKFRMSSALGKEILMVLGRERSVKSIVGGG